MNTYALNNYEQNKTFWRNLKDFWSQKSNRPKPQIFLGDMNLVEDVLDRMPVHEDNQAAVSAIMELKTHLGLANG